MALLHLLDRLVNVFAEQQLDMRPHLRPGLVRDEVHAVLQSIGLTPPEELYELYAWHDGVDSEDTSVPTFLFEEHQFMPLREAAQEYHEVLTYYENDLNPFSLLPCFPFASFQGSVLAIYCSETPLYGLQHPIVNVYYGVAIQYESLSRLIETATEIFAS